MICEMCGKEHEGFYGSGRFCNSFCARKFSTSKKRVEINEKVSKNLKGRPSPLKGRPSQRLHKYRIPEETKLYLSALAKKRINDYGSTDCLEMVRLKKMVTRERREGTGIKQKGCVYDSGYKMIMFPQHHRAWKSGYVYEHILVMEELLGINVLPEYSIHHKDQDKLNNDPDNLMCFLTEGDHQRYHYMPAFPERYKLERDARGLYTCIRLYK